MIGTGSTGIVYLAIDTKLERQAVLKVLRPSLGESARTRFIAEAKATAAIHHPNVVMIYEVSSDGPLSYIAMQWIPGRTLEQKLAEEETLSIPATRMLVEQIAGGLDAVHGRGLIHRDIKPANVWIPDGDEPAKILDFGLVRVNDENPQLTCTGMIAGTPCFMSPEQSRGDKLDVRSDLFSLGCLMYQCLTGQLPFRCDNALATLRSIQMDQPTAPVELDPTIDSSTSDLVMCLLEKLPNRRPASASSFIRALKTDSHQWEFEITEHRPAAKPRRQIQTSWSRSIAALLIGVALAAVGFAYGQQIIRIAMNKGVIEIETQVDDVKIEIVGDGEVVKVIDLATDQSINIKAGEYEIRPVGDQNSISIDKNTLTLSRGEKEIVTVTRNQNTGFSDRSAEGSDRLARVYELNNQVNEIYPVLGPLLSLNGGSTNEISLMKDVESNQLIARGNVEALELIDELIHQLDVSRSPEQKPVNAELGAIDLTAPYRLDSGDVLGIFIDGVLGKFDDDPPIHRPEPGSGLSPAIGFPITVEHDGKISLPFVDPISVRGKTIAEVRQAINKVFKEDSARLKSHDDVATNLAPSVVDDKHKSHPLLDDRARIIVNLIRRRPQTNNSQANKAAAVVPTTVSMKKFQPPRPLEVTVSEPRSESESVENRVRFVTELSMTIDALKRKVLRDPSRENKKVLSEAYERKLDLIDELLLEDELDRTVRRNYQLEYQGLVQASKRSEIGIGTVAPKKIRSTENGI